MKAWLDRTPEIAALLNPAFCSTLILHGVVAGTGFHAASVPFQFPFLMLPLVLHKPTRDRFPRSSITLFSSWITEHGEAKAGFAERAKNLVPYTREALLFALQNGSALITEDGNITVISKPMGTILNASQDVRECIKASTLCGKWFAGIGNIRTAFALLGVSP